MTPMYMAAPAKGHITIPETPLFSNFRKMEAARKQVVEAVLQCVVENRRFTYSDIFLHRESSQKFVRGADV